MKPRYRHAGGGWSSSTSASSLYPRPSIALIIIILYYINHYITLHYITLHYITLHYITLHLLLKSAGLSGLPIVAADVVEVAPAYDHAGITSMAAANIMLEQIALMNTSMNSMDRDAFTKEKDVFHWLSGDSQVPKSDALQSMEVWDFKQFAQQFARDLFVISLQAKILPMERETRDLKERCRLAATAIIECFITGSRAQRVQHLLPPQCSSSHGQSATICQDLQLPCGSPTI